MSDSLRRLRNIWLLLGGLTYLMGIADEGRAIGIIYFVNVIVCLGWGTIAVIRHRKTIASWSWSHIGKWWLVFAFVLVIIASKITGTFLTGPLALGMPVPLLCATIIKAINARTPTPQSKPSGVA